MPTNVLVVDDSAAMRALVCSVIKKIDFHPIPAESGEEGVNLFQENSIDLAVLDVELPGINGFETCKKLRNLRSDWFPIIYLSASKDDQSIIEGLGVGGDAYVAKPINQHVLEAIVKAMGRISRIKRELAKANSELQKRIHIDGLTGVRNRVGFDDAMRRHWLQAKRDKSDLALIVLDVDHFKQYNDNYGHTGGDEILKKVADALEHKAKRPLDVVARYGGEEFAVLLPNTNAPGAEKVAADMVQIIEGLEIPHAYSQTKDILTVSVGYAVASHAKTVEELFEQADKAMYKAKHSGRNCHIQFTPYLG